MKTKKAIAYLRISKGSDEPSNGLGDQRSKVMGYSALYGLDIVDVVVDDGFTASNLDRPGLDEVRRRLKAKEADGVIFSKLDRLTRSVVDLATLVTELTDIKANMWSVSEQIDTRTASGRMVLNILSTVAQWERETIAERTSAALQHKRRQGERVGALAYGFAMDDDGVHLVQNPAEQAVVAMARQLRAEGLPLRAIASKLTEAGHVARNGKAFASEQVRRMVQETEHAVSA